MEKLLPLILVAAAVLPAQDRLPDVVSLELRHLDETYRVLDFAAERIWPGWTGYRAIPFLLEYENGLKLLIGHPNPPAEFKEVPGTRPGGNSVFADRSKLNSKNLAAPLGAGGGPIRFGADKSGNPMRVVRMNFRPAAGLKDPEDDAPSPGYSTENQITIYIHELFHCFQQDRLPRRTFGNLRINADVDYAVWAEIEGRAIQRAYEEKDRAQSLELLRDFLAARRLKRALMTAQQQGEESSDEFAEGTATYSQLRTLEIMRDGGYSPGLPAEDDAYYHGFRDVAPLLKVYTGRLAASARRNEYVYGKAYDYGCFQAVLCDRWFPGWQKSLGEREPNIDKVIAAKLAIPDGDWPKLQARLEQNYPLGEIRKRHTAELGERDEAYHIVSSRSGRVYVVEIKPVQQFIDSCVKGARPKRFGLISLYPKGFESLKFDEVELSGVSVPAQTDQLYFLRTVDTEWKSRPKAYTIAGEKQPDGSVKRAVVTTPLFTLKAPKVSVEEIGSLVKIRVLARVSD